MSWVAYAIIPIDHGWEFLPTVEDIAQMYAKNDATLKVAGEQFEPQLLESFYKLFEHAKDLARDAGWEGDYRGYTSPRVFFLPTEGDFVYGFVWKQDNNGTTFVVSPNPLPWLEQFSLGFAGGTS